MSCSGLTQDGVKHLESVQWTVSLYMWCFMCILKIRCVVENFDDILPTSVFDVCSWF